MEFLNQVICGDVLEVLKTLPSNFVDMVITSPPYWGLRDYGVRGQIGLEQSPQEYIRKIVDIFREIRRILKNEGSLYLNMGDTYFGSMQGYGAKSKSKTGFQDVNDGFYASSRQKPPMANMRIRSNWLQPKQLMLIPARVAIAMQDDGWILRNDIIWHKPNPMPSSVKDRLTTTYEHLFHFVKQKRYYYDLDAIRVPHKHGVPAKFNYRVREAKKGHTGIVGVKASRNEMSKHNRAGEKKGYHLRKGSPKHYVSIVDRVKAYRDDNPENGSNIFGNPKGKNPGDVIQR